MMLLPSCWRDIPGKVSLGSRYHLPTLTVVGEANTFTLLCPYGAGTFRCRPPLFSVFWRRYAIIAAVKALSTLHLRGWLPSAGGTVEGTAHAHIEAAAWMERHRRTLARSIEALQMTGDAIPWGVYGTAEEGTLLCLQVGGGYLLPLLPTA